jgi:adenylosuccinate lyase
MIPRYSRPDMVNIWAPETKFQIWFEIEAHATDALAELGVVPKEAAAAIWAKGAFEVERRLRSNMMSLPSLPTLLSMWANLRGLCTRE